MSPLYSLYTFYPLKQGIQNGDFRILNISIIIPAYNCAKPLTRTLLALSEQTLLPQEVIIIDSSTNDDVLNVVHHWNDRLLICYQRVDHAYPGKARNIGAQVAKGEWLGFLDSKTTPDSTWLKRSISKAKETNSKMVVGLTVFKNGLSPFQKLLWAMSYGNCAYNTLPGSIILKSSFEEIGGFVSHVRAGEDIEWMNRTVKKNIRQTSLTIPLITYIGLPESFGATIKKYYLYAIANADLNIRKGHKRLYLLFIFILITLMIYKWNAIIAGWDQSNHLYISHITKTYILFLTSTVFVFRGIVRPLHNDVPKLYLFPWRWMAIGFMGLILDIVKTPGYVWGAILEMKNMIIKKSAL